MNHVSVISKCALFSFAYFFMQLSAFANQIECQFELHDGKIKIYDYLLEPRYPLGNEAVIACKNSPDGRWITIQAGYRLNVDIWLYDSYTKTNPIKIDTEPGNNVRVIFHGNKVFEVRWGGIGYRMSDFFQTDNTKAKVHIDDVLSYFDVLDIYVCFYERGVKVGKVFGKDSPEKFQVDFDLTNDSSALSPLFVIDKVEITGEDLIVLHHMANGKKDVEIFKPKLLKGNTTKLEFEIE